MGNIGWTGIIIIAILVVILFGKGKISSIMGDLAKGIKSFKKGMSDDNTSKNDDNKISKTKNTIIYKDSETCSNLNHIPRSREPSPEFDYDVTPSGGGSSSRRSGRERVGFANMDRPSGRPAVPI